MDRRLIALTGKSLSGSVENISGIHPNIWGVVSPRLSGSVRNLQGNLSYIQGKIHSGLWGKISPRLFGDISDLWGDISGIEGDATGLHGDCTLVRGNLDDCAITVVQRKKGIQIQELVRLP